MSFLCTCKVPESQIQDWMCKNVWSIILTSYHLAYISLPLLAQPIWIMIQCEEEESIFRITPSRWALIGTNCAFHSPPPPWFWLSLCYHCQLSRPVGAHRTSESQFWDLLASGEKLHENWIRNWS